MTSNPNRLPATSNKYFQGDQIDRQRPIEFVLNGRKIAGFLGDTVLSAVLASGIDTIGMLNGSPIGLSMHNAPAIRLADADGPSLAMERTRARNGAHYVTIAPRLATNPLHRVFDRKPRTLNLALSQTAAYRRPRSLQQPHETVSTDVLVVGGGVAGMSAALAAAKANKRVILVEASPVLGGNTPLFGTIDGEDAPSEAIANLSGKLLASQNVTVMLCSAALAFESEALVVHRCDEESGALVAIAASHVVLATGAQERLPLFPGNRLPGVVGTAEAYHLAHHYGVWIGQSALLATSSSVAYRLATQTDEAGIVIDRIADQRSAPQSRFIEFTRAYGMRQAPATVIAAARPARQGRGLDLALHSVVDGAPQADASVLSDRLVVCGGWQPDLALWHMAGGQSQWNAEKAQLEPIGTLAHVKIVGSAVGWLSRQACIASGKDAVGEALNRKRHAITEQLIDPLYETPDGPTAVATKPDAASHPTYFDQGLRPILAPRPGTSTRWTIDTATQPLGPGDVSAMVRLGLLSPDDAATVARERADIPGHSPSLSTDSADSRPALVPPYLVSRYPEAALWIVKPDDKLEVWAGALIMPDPDFKSPLQSIGVIVEVSDGQAIALVSGDKGLIAWARYRRKLVRLRLDRRYEG